MIRDWRSQWFAGTGGLTSPSFPFGFVQLDAIGNFPAYTGSTDATHGDPYSTQWGYAGIRWAQTAGFGYAPNPRLPGVFMAVSLDTPDSGQKRPHDNGYNVHSPFKQPVAARLSRAALVTAYGRTDVQTGPHATSASLQGGIITVSITNVGAQGVHIRDHALAPFFRNASGFEVLRRSDSVWQSVPIQGHTTDTVSLVHTGGAQSVSKVRYLWYSDPCGFRGYNCPVYARATPLANLSGFHDFLPLPPFILDIA